MTRGASTPNAAHDRLLVVGVATLVLGLVLVRQAVPLAEPAVHLVPSDQTTLMPTERAAPAPMVRLATNASPPDSVPPPPTTRTAHSGATGLLGPCPLPFDLDHDLGQDLAAMAQQGRRINRERPVEHNGAPDTPDVPAKDRALAGVEKMFLGGEASPAAAR